MEIKTVSNSLYEKKSKNDDPIKLAKIAQRDFEAAKVLFEKKLYANAVYMFQQSIEKATKAILVKLDLISSEEELKEKIGHGVSRNVLKLLKCSVASLILEILRQFLQLSKDRAKSECVSLLLDSLHLIYSLYEGYLSEEEETFNAIERFRKIAFEDVAKEVVEKAKEFIDKYFSYTYMLSGLMPDEIFTNLAHINKCLGKDAEVLKEHLTKKSMELYLRETLGFLMLFHIPFEDTVNKLRYNIENIDESKFIVQWSKQIMDQIENTKMLKCIEECIKEEITDPKCKEVLNAILNVFIVKLESM